MFILLTATMAFDNSATKRNPHKKWGLRLLRAWKQCHSSRMARHALKRERMHQQQQNDYNKIYKEFILKKTTPITKQEKEDYQDFIATYFKN
jgi:hypothetical protein